MKRNRRSIILSLICFFFFAASLCAEVLQEIVVKEGDTLWGVANYYLKDPQRWPDILKYNSLPSSDVNVILPGMKLRVPILLIKEHLRTAYLIYILNDVRYRRRAEAEWHKARTDMELFNDDGLRTLQESKAKVRFASGEMLQVDENSLIILKPEKKREEVDLLSGGVRASKTKVLTNGSLVDPRIEPRGPNPDFRTKIKEDRTTLVEVYEGIVDVTAQGKTVTLTKGFGTTVKFREAPSLPTALPPPPDINVTPAANIPNTNLTASGKVIGSALQLGIKAAAPQPITTTPGVKESKSDAKAQVLGQIIKKYRLQVSTSPAFTSSIMDETMPIKDGTVNIDLKKANLADGIYYYRVSYIDELGFEGQHSTPVQFIIDTVAPALEITAPANEEEVDTEFVHVEGNTEPAVTLKANNKPVTVDDDGKFITALMPKNGRNTVTLIAQDRAGNTTKKEIVFYKVKDAAKKSNTVKIESRIKEKGSRFANIALGSLVVSVIVGVLVLILK